MAKRVKVEVTEKHIKKGKCGSASQCAIAQALLEQYGGKRKVASVTVIDSALVTLKDSTSIRLEFPKKALNFIETFDLDKKSAKPITFTATIAEN